MQHFDGEIERLIRAGIVSLDIGMAYATNAGNLRLELSDLASAPADPLLETGAYGASVPETARAQRMFSVSSAIPWFCSLRALAVSCIRSSPETARTKTGEMIVGVISDTHGLLRPEAVEALRILMSSSMPATSAILKFSRSWRRLPRSSRFAETSTRERGREESHRPTFWMPAGSCFTSAQSRRTGSEA